MNARIGSLLCCVGLMLHAGTAFAEETPLGDVPVNRWTKLTPLDATPVSPRLAYEACAWDSWRKVMIRYGGHNQGSGGEQNAEIWTFDPTSGLYVRFPAFSGSRIGERGA